MLAMSKRWKPSITLAGAFEALPELFDQLQSECQNRFKYYYRGHLPLPKE